MIISEEDYLEHFGVKGMKWGVRKQRRGGTAEERRAGNRRFARNLAIGVGVGGASGLAIAALIKRHQNVKLREITTAGDNIRRATAAFSAHQARTAAGASYLKARADSFKAIPLGPIGSTGVARLGGAIPMNKIRGG